jgi:hypothetical protein
MQDESTSPISDDIEEGTFCHVRTLGFVRELPRPTAHEACASIARPEACLQHTIIPMLSSVHEVFCCLLSSLIASSAPSIRALVLCFVASTNHNHQAPYPAVIGPLSTIPSRLPSLFSMHPITPLYASHHSTSLRSTSHTKQQVAAFANQYSLMFLINGTHQRSSRRQDIVHEDEDCFLRGELDAFADYVDELADG